MMGTSAVESKQPQLWAVEFITFAAATVFIILRFVSRRLTRVHIWWDDWLALSCYAMALAWVVIIPVWISRGLGLHIDDITNLSKDDALYQTKLLLYVAELFYASALFFGKASILTFYWRMFRVTNIKLPIQILLTCSVIWIIIRTIMGIFHCTPVHAFWDAEALKTGRCDIEDTKFFFGTILVHVLIDIAILALPVMQIRKLQLPLLQRVGIMLMFMFGIFICVAAMVIIVASTQYDATSEDMTWGLCTIVIWATVEVNLVTVSACLPTIRPACIYLFTCNNPASTIGSGSNSYGQSYGLSQNKKSMRLSTLPKRVDDENSSTHQLADSELEQGDFERHTVDRYRGNTSTVTGPAADGASDGFAPSSFGGIIVKNETTVRVSTSKPL